MKTDNSEDPLGLLAGKAAGPQRASEDEIAIRNFGSISAFIDHYGVLPGSIDGGASPCGRQLRRPPTAED